MNITHHCLICLGSNIDADTHLTRALASLRSFFRIVQCGSVVCTHDTDSKLPHGDFLNQMLVIECQEDKAALRALLKLIEKENGRTAESKLSGVMPLDIDLLVYDGEVLKPDDMEKGYVIEAMHGLPDGGNTGSGEAAPHRP